MKECVYWKNAAGYDGKYQVSIMGEIKHVYPSGKEREIKTYIKSTSKNRKYVVHISKNGEKCKTVNFSKLVYETFKGPVPEGYVVIHKNRLQSDNRLENLTISNRQNLGINYGGDSNRKSVVKLDQNGEAVAWYKSAREAGRKNYMSYQTIIDRCSHRVKSKFAPDGYEYLWGDEMEEK